MRGESEKTVLTQITEIREYLRFLATATVIDRYLIVVSVKGTVGKGVVSDIAGLFNKIGIQNDLTYSQANHYRAFVAVIKDGKIVFECYGEPRREVNFSGKFGEVKLDVCSSPYGLLNLSEIVINDVDFSTNWRGINIVVYDHVANVVVDSIAFDTAFTEVPSRRRAVLDQTARSILYGTGSTNLSVGEFLLETGTKRCAIVFESAKYKEIEPIVSSILYVKEIELQLFSEKRYICSNELEQIYRPEKIDIFALPKILEFDTCLVLTQWEDSRTEKLLTYSFVRVFNPTTLAKNIYSWCCYTRPLAVCAKKHPKTTVISFDFTYVHIDGATDNEKCLLESGTSWDKQLEQLQKGNDIETNSFDGMDYANDDIIELLTPINSYYDAHGNCKLSDTAGKNVNVSDGHRVTCYQPKEYDRTIYLIGSCSMFGLGARDDETFASHLQRRLLENPETAKIRVENYGMFTSRNQEKMFEMFALIDLKDCDILIANLNTYEQSSEFMESIQCKDWSKRPHSYGECYIDRNHLNGNGYRLFADKFFDALKERDFYRNYDISDRIVSLSEPHQPLRPFGIKDWNVTPKQEEISELNNYKHMLTSKRVTIGSIVVNCNPFTLGHRFLVEYASSRVAHLYVFVVEEDRSIFPFADRIELVKQGTADLTNVTVLPSGKFIISSLTFTDYFNKSELQDRTIDPSFDVELFGKEIAPTLGITVRFAGEEPLDAVTRQYNETMARILPEYGVRFEEIRRKETGGGVISASRVRKLLEENKFDEIERLVPKTTFDYLRKIS